MTRRLIIPEIMARKNYEDLPRRMFLSCHSKPYKEEMEYSFKEFAIVKDMCGDLGTDNTNLICLRDTATATSDHHVMCF
ncbi:hypothetical protein J6590_065929 [Homalodisca vitripennis]|nr:hypothetical protein J6590_065929 [Homalodisca vitripennis]